MLLDQIEQVIHQSPGLTGTQIAHILFGIGGYHQRIGHACQALVEAGGVERRGKGGPAHPFTYHPKAPALSALHQ